MFIDRKVSAIQRRVGLMMVAIPAVQLVFLTAVIWVAAHFLAKFW